MASCFAASQHWPHVDRKDLAPIIPIIGAYAAGKHPRASPSNGADVLAKRPLPALRVMLAKRKTNPHE
jgi:hypothetical protein